MKKQSIKQKSKPEIEEPKKMGRPSKYTKEIGELICLEIATTSKGLKTICTENELFPSYVTVFSWLMDEDKKEFLNSYTRAREAQADVLADEILSISDDGKNDTYTDSEGNVMVDYDVLGRSKIRIEARKFLAAKLKPKKYGDKIDLTTQGEKITAAAPDLTHLSFEQLKELQRGAKGGK